MRTCTLFIRLPNKDFGRKDIIDIFKSFGYITSIKVFSERGYAFVEMDSRENAEIAIKTLRRKGIGDTSLSINWAFPKRRKPTQYSRHNEPEKNKADVKTTAHTFKVDR